MDALGGVLELQKLKQACGACKGFSMSKAVGLFPDTFVTEKQGKIWTVRVRVVEQVVTANRHFN